jgi:hypothetical protein
MKCRVCRIEGHTSCTLCNGCFHNRNNCPTRSDINNDGSTEEEEIVVHSIADNTECPICLEDIKHDACTSRCGHKFCSVCFLKSFKESRVCPMCRSNLLPPTRKPPRKIRPRIRPPRTRAVASPRVINTRSPGTIVINGINSFVNYLVLRFSS